MHSLIFLGKQEYTVILNLLNLKEFEMKEIDYLWTEYADTEKTFSALETSVLYAGHEYGPLYTEETWAMLCVSVSLAVK